ncbi:MAG: TAXI family TRAP transporter solute-binding subunit, partial [Chloroflexota bacterium]
GKRLAHSPQMGWAKTMIESMLKSNGMTLDNVKLIPVTTGTEAANMLTERTIDGFCFPGGTATVELQRTIGLRMIPMSQKAFDLFVPQYPGHELGIAPKGWEGTPEDTQTALTYVGVWIREGVNDITVYTMMKTLFENIGELHQAHVKGKGFNLATAATRFEATTPFHSGVIRYYKEKGVWGAKEEAEQQKLLAKEKEIYGK